jgi:hypothetical protein
MRRSLRSEEPVEPQRRGQCRLAGHGQGRRHARVQGARRAHPVLPPLLETVRGDPQPWIVGVQCPQTFYTDLDNLICKRR